MEWFSLFVFLVQGVYVCSDLNSFPEHRQPQKNWEALDGFKRRSDRTKRFLTFNNDESNIRVEIEFTVPFLEIPLGSKGSLGGGPSPMLSVNAKSAIVVTTLFFASYLFVPKLVHHFLPKVRRRHQGRESDGSDIDSLLQGVESAFHVNATACWQQGVCSLVQRSRHNTSSAGLGKVLDGLSSMSWLETLTRGTALDEAFVLAKQDSHSCQVFLSRCTLDSKNLGGTSFHEDLARSYMNQLVKLYNSRSRPRN